MCLVALIVHSNMCLVTLIVHSNMCLVAWLCAKEWFITYIVYVDTFGCIWVFSRCTHSHQLLTCFLKRTIFLQWFYLWN